MSLSFLPLLCLPLSSLTVPAGTHKHTNYLTVKVPSLFIFVCFTVLVPSYSVFFLDCCFKEQLAEESTLILIIMLMMPMFTYPIICFSPEMYNALS